jgi:subtilase family serine protease
MSKSTIEIQAALMLAFGLPVSSLLAQPSRVTEGNVHPLAQVEYDRGAVQPSMQLGYVTLMVKRTASQQAALDKLLADQQDPGSRLYHLWLTPEEFADRFGASQTGIDSLTAWLQSNGFTVKQVARGRDFIVFSGSAAQIAAALKTEIHRYQVNGETHYANMAPPAIPENLAALVDGFRGLDDFRPTSAMHGIGSRGAWPAIEIAGATPSPDWYSQKYPDINIVAPADLATIYNVHPFYDNGIDGSGQLIAVAGDSAIDLTDIEIFRQAFGLPFNNPKTILLPGSDDPGINGDIGEADLDLEWSGAIARNATLIYVYGTDAFAAAFYAIDQALAPVLSLSFGECELRITPSEVRALASEGQKAAAVGITWLVSTGDSGAAACESQNGPFSTAITRANVNLPASLPWATAVGGSEFSESNGTYWTKTGSNYGSAICYIPEGAWTDENFLAENPDYGYFAASGGGASWYFTKPSWQTGRGVPNDGARDIPDVALTASWFHDPYALITGGTFIPNGGTSASTPTFAGIVSLLNQYLMATGEQARPGLGNINPTLYTLAQNSPNAFHDITAGDNIVPCVVNSTQDCPNGFFGYTAKPGYDLVTGLGSVDAYALAHAWATSFGTPHLAITQFTASTNVRAGGQFSMNMVVANQGKADAGAFEMRVLFTTSGTVNTAKPWYLYCDADSLSAGATFTCSGAVTLDPAIVPGTYYMLGVADANQSVPQTDRSGGTSLASTGTLTVTY